ncbi:GTP-binding protein [Methylobacillus arboreus]|uniref:CobW family GTP-binding protein n=1 Tax=Methylobacillus arboreus TaxID=755170 RepID=UPI001E3DA024|nr:GTP-binding protein [Methylobacillus arboreus]MCB5190022.1 GTP-binding protein [Methylobacillus arboreus]
MPDRMRLPVTLLTGFLGSGKTTLLNRWLRQPEMRDTLVIINEFGEIGLDHMLVAHQLEHNMVVELSNGCLCCQLRTDLKQTLKDIHWRFSRNGVRQFRRVVIEASGMADPAPVLHTLMTDAYVAAAYQLDGVVTVVDGILGSDSLRRYPEAVKQVQLADILLISKADIADQQGLASLLADLHELNPAARVLQLDQLQSQAVGAGLLFGLASSTGFPHWLSALAAPALHGGEATTLSLELDVPVPRHDFDGWLEQLRHFTAPGLLRFKGVFHVAGEPSPIAVHRVQHVLHAPEPLVNWPGKDKRSQLVFITQSSSEGELRPLLQSLVRFARNGNRP